MTKLQFLLTKLAEECCEVSQMALKTQQFGVAEKLPGQDKTNKQRLHEELNDLNGIIYMLNEEFGFDYKPDGVAIYYKKLKVEKYLGYSIKLGLVNETGN